MNLTAWTASHAFHIFILCALVVAWNLFTFAITFLFRKHSADEYAKWPAWFGHVMRFCEGTGMSAPQLIAFVTKLFPRVPPTIPLVVDSANGPPTPPPTPPAALRARTRRLVPMLVAICAFAFIGCSAAARQIETKFLDASAKACVLFYADAGLLSPAIATACNIDEILVPSIDELLSAQKAAAAMKRDKAAGLPVNPAGTHAK